jgi:hypothetical protein
VTRQWTRGVAFERARSTARPRGEKEGRRGGGSGCGGATRRGGNHGAWPRPTGGAWQQPETGGRARCAPRGRCRPNRGEEEGADRWAAAQCRAVVPLTGGSGLLAVHGRESRAHGRAWADPRRKRSGRAQMNSTVSVLFKLV